MEQIESTSSIPGAILVAGGTSGIGRALVTGLLKDGRQVVSLDQTANEDEDTDFFMSLTVDLRELRQVHRTIEKISHRGVEITGLAVVAGVGDATPFEELEADGFAGQVENNLHLVFNLCSTCVDAFSTLETIVTVSSTSIYGGHRASVGYMAAKAGVVGLTRGLASELAPRGIRVNCIAPGPVRTPLFERLSTASERRLMAHLTPLERISEAEDIAEAIRFMLDTRSRHITGQVLCVDGGLSLALKPTV